MLHELFDKQPPRRKAVPPPFDPGPALVDDLGSFGWLRNERDRAVMLEIRHANGDITAFSYPLLESARFNPSTGITLIFSGVTVTITGRNLNSETRSDVRFFEGIMRHRVLWIQEADGPTVMQASETAVIIEEVKAK
jgi:hypothetical protein